MVSKGNILIIDDMLQNLQLLVDILSKHGYTVRPANNGQLGIDSAHHQKPDLILLDINMPDMDGYSVCSAFKAEPALKEVPIIFLSAYDKLFDKVRAFKIGAADYITKPFEEMEVLVRVDTHLAIYRQRQQIEALAAQQVSQMRHTLELQQEFFNSAVHDLKNPLSLIIRNANMVMDDMRDEQPEPVTIIRKSAEFMNELVTDILDLARLESGIRLEYDDILLDYLIKDVCRYCIGRTDIDLTLTLPEQDELVTVDPFWTKRALANVLSNAIKFTPVPGKIEVRATVNDETFTISVRDSGIGIPEHDLPHVFDRYYRGSHNPAQYSTGTGLGLAIVKSAVEAHGGTVMIESEFGTGTTVYLTFPME